MTAQPLILYEAAPNWRELSDPLGTAPDAVRNIVKKMKSVAHKLPVGDVDDIAWQVEQWRTAHPDLKISSVDLVAHATAGRVCVGFSTNKTEVGTTNTNGVRHFVLDSAPKVYRVLIGIKDVVDDNVPLRLLGCSTATVVNGYGLDGRVLMIALANMLDCRVDGTNTALDINDFGPTGFIASTKLRSVHAKYCIPVSGSYDPSTCDRDQLVKPPMTADVPHLESPGAEYVSQESLSTERGATLNGQTVSGAWVNGLLSLFAHEGVRYPKSDTLLALSELIVYLNNGERLELLDTGRLLRWRRAKDTVVFSQREAKSRSTHTTLSSLLGSYAPWWSITSTPR